MSFLLEGFPRWDRIEAQIRFLVLLQEFTVH